MKIKFIPNDVEFEIGPNDSVLKIAHDNGIHIKSVCKGVPSCAECKIQIAEGEYNVFPPLPVETNLIGSAHFVDRSRLACQLKCFGNVTIDLSEQIEKAGRNLASKRPRGSRAVSDGDDFDLGASKAIQGSIILDDKKTFDDIEETEKEIEVQREAQKEAQRQRQAQQRQQQQNRPQNNNQQNNQNRNNQNRNAQGPQQNNQRNNNQNRNNQGPRNPNQGPQNNQNRNSQGPRPQQKPVQQPVTPSAPPTGNKPKS